MTGTLQFKIYH